MPQAIEAARQTLAACWDGLLPVNPLAIAYKLGATVSYVSDITASGYFDYGGDGKPVIYVNPNEPTVRQRFTVFHELGHYVLGHGPSQRPVSAPQSWAYDPKEVAANQFAAEMIMPEGAVRQLAQNRTLVQMAAVFAVSERAMAIRLQRLHVVCPQ